MRLSCYVFRFQATVGRGLPRGALTCLKVYQLSYLQHKISGPTGWPKLLLWCYRREGDALEAYEVTAKRKTLEEASKDAQVCT